MRGKLARIRRQQYKKNIDKFCASDIGVTLEKRLKLFRIIIIGQAVAFGIAVVAAVLIWGLK